MNTETLIRDVDGDLFIGGSRVLLRNIVTAYRRGSSADEIRTSFPSLSLAQIYGAFVYYLEHQAALDMQFAEDDHLLDVLRAKNAATHKEFYEAMRSRFDAARKDRDEQQGAEPGRVSGV